jgi:hypothetical protein
MDQIYDRLSHPHTNDTHHYLLLTLNFHLSKTNYKPFCFKLNFKRFYFINNLRFSYFLEWLKFFYLFIGFNKHVSSRIFSFCLLVTTTSFSRFFLLLLSFKWWNSQRKRREEKQYKWSLHVLFQLKASSLKKNEVGYPYYFLSKIIGHNTPKYILNNNNTECQKNDNSFFLSYIHILNIKNSMTKLKKQDVI